MVNTMSYITFLHYLTHGQFAFCCDCQPPYRRNVVFILVVIIFQLLRARYSVEEYTCVNKHMISDNEQLL